MRGSLFIFLCLSFLSAPTFANPHRVGNFALHEFSRPGSGLLGTLSLEIVSHNPHANLFHVVSISRFSGGTKKTEAWLAPENIKFSDAYIDDATERCARRQDWKVGERTVKACEGNLAKNKTYLFSKEVPFGLVYWEDRADGEILSQRLVEFRFGAD